MSRLERRESWIVIDRIDRDMMVTIFYTTNHIYLFCVGKMCFVFTLLIVLTGVVSKVMFRNASFFDTVVLFLLHS